MHHRRNRPIRDANVGCPTERGVNLEESSPVQRLAAADHVEHLPAGELAVLVGSRLGDDALSDAVQLAALGRVGNRELGTAVHAAAGAGASLAAMSEAADMAPVEVRQRWPKWARRRVRDGVLGDWETRDIPARHLTLRDLLGGVAATRLTARPALRLAVTLPQVETRYGGCHTASG
ncbi:hypothetical protein [Nonomuraea endophytica]|uniref:hypothetical protein n=1 Tax=Nonomuraea endophytica TaxID=714136 RepID=UPI0037C59582